MPASNAIIAQIEVYNSYNEKVADMRIDGMLIKKFSDGLLTWDQLMDLLFEGIKVRSDAAVANNGELFIVGSR